MNFLNLILAALWFILPAYVANAAPVALGGGRPIDGGKKFRDGRPLLGPGKTIRGFLAGLVAGSSVGFIQGLAVGSCTLPAIGLLLAVGALVGDLSGSFIKRRLNIPRGGAAPLLDQLGFVLMALLFASPLVIPRWETILTLIVVTPPIHLGTNFIGYKLGMKKKPY
mgnify:CR=1 FL=1